MKRKLIKFDWIVNNSTIHNLLVNYVNLKKRVNTEAASHRCFVAVLSEAAVSRCSLKISAPKNFAIFRGKYLC